MTSFENLSSPSSIERLLRSSRQQPLPESPPDELLDESDAGLTLVPEADVALWFNHMGVCVDSSIVAGKRLVFDLDDTLLFGSHTTAELWNLAGGYQDPAILPGYQYKVMRTGVRGWYNGLRGRPRYDRADRKSYPFLNSPRLVAMPNVPFLSTLVWLKSLGANPVLVTASARRRVSYFFAKFPIFRSIFGDAVYAAEDILRRHLSLDHGSEDADSIVHWKNSATLHAKRPNSLAAKSPWLVSPLFDDREFDLLIDDSHMTLRLFQQSDLSHKLFHFQPHSIAPNGLWSETLRFMEMGFGLKGSGQSCDSAPTYRELVCEDPLYWPLLHIRDQIRAPRS